MTEKKYPQPTDLGIGKHIIRVYPKPEFADGKPIQGTQKHGTGKNGKPYWLYQFKHNDKYIGIAAFDEERKAFLDSGTVEINVVQKIDRATKRPIFDLVDDKPVPVLTYFVNQNPAEAVAKAGTPEAKAEVYEEMNSEKGDDDSLPF